ncbi:MAG: 50S ribosomal protein L6 [Candidatus Latescibacteria bacterium]|nr:50S ribosomal protein L6 [Candidatus Latescibacterota bacterium]
MSRVGKEPILIPSGVEVKLEPRSVHVKGAKGEVQVHVNRLARVQQENGTLRVSVEDPEDRRSRAMWGLVRSLVANAVLGVTEGFEKRLVVVGVGYRAELKGKALEIQVGYSHPVLVEALPGIEFSTEDAPSGIEGAQVSIVVRGADKELVGRTAANIRKIRPPEPYKGKGIRYDGEYVRRKAGKAAVT